MNANELRIGNWVTGSFPNMVVSALNSHHADLYMAESEADDFSYEYHELEGIPLTPEILIACGFEKHSNSNEFWNFYQLKNGWHIAESLHDEISAGVKTGFYYWSDEFIEFKNLHQLQNLYWCLCGKELNIQL